MEPPDIDQNPDDKSPHMRASDPRPDLWGTDETQLRVELMSMSWKEYANLVESLHYDKNRPAGIHREFLKLLYYASLREELIVVWSSDKDTQEMEPHTCEIVATSWENQSQLTAVLRTCAEINDPAPVIALVSLTPVVGLERNCNFSIWNNGWFHRRHTITATGTPTLVPRDSGINFINTVPDRLFDRISPTHFEPLISDRTVSIHPAFYPNVRAIADSILVATHRGLNRQCPKDIIVLIIRWYLRAMSYYGRTRIGVGRE
jgi:hypothetical protein